MDILKDGVNQDFLKPENWTEETKGIIGKAEEDLIIVTNPPYSILSKWLDKTLALKPVIFSYLLAAHALTPCRLEKMEKAGYVLTDMTVLSVRGWFGMSFCLTWIRKDRNISKSAYTPIVSYCREKYLMVKAGDPTTE